MPVSSKTRRSRKSVAECFWSKVKRSDGCWEWQGRRDANGYGRFDVYDENRTYPRIASEVALELTLGRPVRDGYDACHTCDNPGCVRPDHLFEGTRLENVQDMKRKGREANRKGANAPRLKVTMDVARQIQKNAEVMSGRAVARMMGLSPTTVFDVLNGEHWTQREAHHSKKLEDVA